MVDFGDIKTVKEGPNIFVYVKGSGRWCGVTVAVFDRYDGSHGIVVEIFSSAVASSSSYSSPLPGPPGPSSC